MIDDPDVRIRPGDALEILPTLEAESVQCIVTSPPFWGLRDYGHDAQIGLEETPEEWCAKLVAVMREARRVLRSDGVCWIEVGDTYNSGSQNNHGRSTGLGDGNRYTEATSEAWGGHRAMLAGMKRKDLVGAPWLLAFALRADGWYLRSDTIWARPNPMPESVTDRPTKAHSYVFLLAKSERYFYDGDAIREENSGQPQGNVAGFAKHQGAAERFPMLGGVGTSTPWQPGAGRNARSVWRIPSQSSAIEHFAMMPEALAARCIAAGSRVGDVVLDPFMGSGTTALVARRMGRLAIGCELNPEYIEIARKRLEQQSLFA